MENRGTRKALFDGRTYASVCSQSIFPEDCKDVITYDDLPSNIIFQMFPKLSIRDIVRCKCVCKTWHDLVNEYFLNVRRNNASTKSILLQPVCPCCPRNSLYMMVSGKCMELPMRNIREESSYYIADSCNGFLCIVSDQLRNSDPVLIYNPITGERKKLPRQKDRSRPSRSNYGFGYDKMSNKYKVVCVYRPFYYDGEWNEWPTVKGEIITEGDAEWRKLKFPYLVDIQVPVFLDGAFHWMIDREEYPTSCSEVVLALDINSEKFDTISFPASVELPGYLSLINFAESLAFVKNSTLDSSSKIWQIVGSKENGRWLYQHNCKFVSDEDGKKYSCTVLGMLSNGSYLYEARYRLQKRERRHGLKVTSHLALYNPELGDSFIIQMCGAPHSFRTFFFTPTLASPNLICFPDERRKTRRHKQREESPRCSVSPSLIQEWVLNKEASLRNRRGRRGRRKAILRRQERH